MKKTDIQIYGCTILPMNGKEWIKDGMLIIKNGKIAFVGEPALANSTEADVDTVIVDGKILMENRQVKTLDEQAVMKKAEKLLWICYHGKSYLAAWSFYLLQRLV